jgi:hypothetical protein
LHLPFFISHFLFQVLILVVIWVCQLDHSLPLRTEKTVAME